MLCPSDYRERLVPRHAGWFSRLGQGALPRSRMSTTTLWVPPVKITTTGYSCTRLRRLNMRRCAPQSNLGIPPQSGVAPHRMRTSHKCPSQSKNGLSTDTSGPHCSRCYTSLPPVTPANPRATGRLRPVKSAPNGASNGTPSIVTRPIHHTHCARALRAPFRHSGQKSHPLPRTRSTALCFTPALRITTLASRSPLTSPGWT